MPLDTRQLQIQSRKIKVTLTEAMTPTPTLFCLSVSLSLVKCMQNFNVPAAVWEMYGHIVVDRVIIRHKLGRKDFRIEDQPDLVQ